MIGGRGWIAVGLVIFVRWHRCLALVGALLFDAIKALIPAAPNYFTKLDCLPGCSSEDNPTQYESINAGDYIVSRYEAILN